MTLIQYRFRKLDPVAAVMLLVLAAQFPANVAQANGAYGTNTDLAGKTISVPTYYASSPQGRQPVWDPATNAIKPGTSVDTGTPLRKFVDPLGGAYNGLDSLPGWSDLQSGIPVAITEKWVNLAGATTSDDYYEIAIVEYTEQMHSDLPKATRLRGYVQIETSTMGSKKDITGLIGSEHIPATYPDGTPIYKWTQDPATGIWAKSADRVYFVHKPHYLGPVILAARGTPVRLKVTNYLPYHDASGNSVGSWNGQGGELSIPVDQTIAGGGPVLDKNDDPVIGQDGKPIKMAQNRAAIHWHGGDTPWISDGTPHQWFAPAGDISYTMRDPASATPGSPHFNGLGKGDSAADVPDMLPSGPGSYTLYFPNNLSGRLMMYHDHTSGLTKVNVYLGEAAGYVVYDPIELTLVANAIGTTLDKKVASGAFTGLPIGLLDSVGIPLVIQDKTFVPKNIGPNAVAADGFTPQSQDAKWDLNHWGQYGDLYFPHVYETNQDPNSADGTNPVGRWDWGPWFWPVFPAQFSLPSGAYGDATATPEAFMDTSVVNGQAYPTMTVDPKTYRFRILSVANDRTHNLGLYQAVDAAGRVCNATNTAPLKATPMAGGLPLAACTEVKMVPALATAGFPANWPKDGRVGGVPDPATAGPDIVQIGSEGGLLPVPAIWKSQPVTYETNVRNITMLNIKDHDLLLAGGERADVLIDFSKYAGQTLILYNDAPTPMPALDPRTDYYTGGGDKTDAGGAHDTLPGYGPNTRTIMQIKVNATNTSGTGGALNVTALATAMPKAYAQTQPEPIIPQAAYNAPFGTNNVNTYASIGTGSGATPNFRTNTVTSVKVVSAGSGYTTAPTVSFSGPGTGAAATASIDAAGTVTGITVTKAGAGYTTAPTVTLSASATGVIATATALNTLLVINKAIQELFDPIFGRMNATLAVELPFSTAAIATTIPLSYTDVPVERLDAIKDGETQIWKVTHNGVDGHPVHFHMVNVQVINRVGWDGTIKPPDANEVGWKETLRMNPLEDVYVAVQAKRPVAPFGVPKSKRVLDPSIAIGSTLGLTQIDPTTGQAPREQWQIVNGSTTNVAVSTTAYSNQLTDFDNEYVWHCHILGHEEQDFMRPFIFHPYVVKPDAPAAVTVSGSTVRWTDTTPVGGQDAEGIPTAGSNAAYPEPTSSPRNEIGFKILRTVTTDVATITPAGGGNPAVTNTVTTKADTTLATVPANTTSWTGNAVDTPAPATVVAGDVTTTTTVSYSVIAYNVAGDSVPGTTATTTNAGGLVGTGSGPTGGSATGGTAVVSTVAGPTGLTQTLNTDGSVTLRWVGVAGATSYIVSVDGGAANAANGGFDVTVAGTLTRYRVPAANLRAGVNHTFSLTAMTLSGATAGSATNVYTGTAYPPVAVSASPGVATGTLTLNWANDARNVNNVTGLALSWTRNGNAVRMTFAPNTTGATVIGLTTGTSYSFTLVANSRNGNSSPVTVSATAP